MISDENKEDLKDSEANIISVSSIKQATDSFFKEFTSNETPQLKPKGVYILVVILNTYR